MPIDLTDWIFFHLFRLLNLDGVWLQVKRAVAIKATPLAPEPFPMGNMTPIQETKAQQVRETSGGRGMPGDQAYRYTQDPVMLAVWGPRRRLLGVCREACLPVLWACTRLGSLAGLWNSSLLCFWVPTTLAWIWISNTAAKCKRVWPGC